MEAYPYNSFEYDYYDDLTLEQNIKIALFLLMVALIIFLKYVFFN
jgi:hypothetical protein